MELFTYTFVQYAFIAGACAALLAGILGPMVVSSKQSIASDMLAHVALAGVGLAAVFDFLPLLGAFVVLLLSAFLLWWITTREEYSSDAVAMLFLSGGLALALALVHIAQNQSVSFESYLFGSILTITSTEILLMIILTVVAITTILVFWRPLLGVVQSPAYRVPYSNKPQYIQLVFFILLGLTVWIGLKTVGGLLIGALLVIPVLIVRPFVGSFMKLTLYTIVVSQLSMIAGLLLSLYIDVPPSSLIIGVLVASFATTLLGRKFIHQNS